MSIPKLVLILQKKVEVIEQYIVILSLFSFIAHLFLIFLVNETNIIPNSKGLFGKNYLYAITTPLNIILFYEILVLVLALPKSIFITVGKQMQIVTLILVRQVFKIISESDNIIDSFQNNDFLIELTLFFGGSILAFLLVTLFNKYTYSLVNDNPDEGILKYVKAYLTFFSLLLLFVFAGYEVYLTFIQIMGWGSNTFDYIYSLFYLLIFIDVIIFLLALYYTDDFGIVFIDSAFILAGIFLRFSISFDGIYKVGTILVSMLGILCIILIYKYLWSKNPLTETKD